jgi:hypothetical protein
MKHIHTFESFLNEAKEFSFTFDYNTDEDDIEYIQNVLKKAGVTATAEAGVDSEEMVVKAANAIELRKAQKAIEADGFQIHEAVKSIPKDSPGWVHKIFKDKEYVEITPSTKLAKGDALVGINSGTFYEVFKDNGAKVIVKDDAWGDQTTYTREKIENSFLIKQK